MEIYDSSRDSRLEIRLNDEKIHLKQSKAAEFEQKVIEFQIFEVIYLH